MQLSKNLQKLNIGNLQINHFPNNDSDAKTPKTLSADKIENDYSGNGDVSSAIAEIAQDIANGKISSSTGLQNILAILKNQKIKFKLKIDKKMIHLDFKTPQGKQYSFNICTSAKFDVQKEISDTIKNIVENLQSGNIDNITAKKQIIDTLKLFGIKPNVDKNGTISFDLNGKIYEIYLPVTKIPDSTVPTAANVETEMADGKLVSRTTKDEQGRIVKFEKFDNEENLEYVITYTYNTDGSHNEVTQNAEGKTTEETDFDSNGNKTSRKLFDSNERIETKEEYIDREVSRITSYIYNTDGTSKEIVKNADGKIIEERECKDNNVIQRTVYSYLPERHYDEESGTFVSIEGDTYYDATIYDGNGNIIGYKESRPYDVYDRFDITPSPELIYGQKYPVNYYIKGGNTVLIRDADGNPVSAIIYSNRNNEEVEATVTFDTAPDGRKRRVIRQIINGRVVLRTSYDNGNGLYDDAYTPKLKTNDKALSKYSTMTIYQTISDMTNTSSGNISWIRSSMPNTVKFLELACPRYNKGLPSGCIKIDSYADTPYSSILSEMITQTIVNEYGYGLDEVIGYEFSSDSDISKLISQNSNFINYVKNNLARLMAGVNFEHTSGAMTYNFANSGNSDLKNTLGDLYIAHSEVINGELHLTLLDTYDFDASKWNDGSGLNAAGIAAMQEGNLVPYFEVIHVVIPLSQLQ